MKKLSSFALILCHFLSFSCEDTNLDSEAGFIKAKVDGVETFYSALPADQDYYNYIRPGAINIRFNKSRTSAQFWSIDIYYGYSALDINNLRLPFTIKGPNPDFSGKSPEVHMAIIDPQAGSYGKQIVAGSSFEHEVTLTITSIENNLVRGTFDGIGIGKFESGEFAARLPVKDW
jgi:hypothetical protein